MSEENKPISLLSRMAERSLASAKGLPAQVDITPHWSGIGFLLGGQRFVAPMGEIVEMLPTPGFTRLPNVQPWVMGVANVRGRLCPLFDLEAFLGGRLAANRKRHRVLIVEMGELYSGLIVSEVYGMQHFPIDTFTENTTESTRMIKEYLGGSYVQMDMTWTIFSPYKLIRDPRFFNAAAA